MPVVDAAAVDELLDAAPSEGAQGGVDGNAARAAGELRRVFEWIALRAGGVLDVLRLHAHRRAMRRRMASDGQAAVVRDIEPLVRVGGPGIRQLDAVDEMLAIGARRRPQSERAVDVQP